ncbi:hypothetical protein BG005_007906 [Podila minutissima]|nr:hypothetical protein BG005_007906 [Podila minutissima]
MFVMATLPLVEHSLRQMYVSLNECKEDRNFALVAGEYYLTLDVILEPHGEFNTFIGRDIKQEPWLEFYVVLILGLLQHSMTAKNDICFGEHRNALDIAHTCIRNYISTRFDEWTVARRETMRCFSLLASYRNLVFLSEASWIEIAPLIKGDSAFSLENLDSRLLPDQLSKALMAWPIRLTTDSGQAIGSTHNLPAWIIIIQRIQDCIYKVTRKILSLSEQLQKRQLSSRSRKQFEAMKPVMPRLMGMLVNCLCLVEQRVLVCAKELKVMSSCSTEDLGLLERASQEDIQVRSQLTMFVDKFASNFERAKLNLMDVAWEDLAKGIAGLEAAYILNV